MIIRGTLIAACVLTAWIALLAGTLKVTGAAPAMLVVLPDAAFLQNLPKDAAIVGWSSMSITLASAEPEFIDRLYASGARLVLPAGLKGCAG